MKEEIFNFLPCVSLPLRGKVTSTRKHCFYYFSSSLHQFFEVPKNTMMDQKFELDKIKDHVPHFFYVVGE
jgi:hypothetical protein